jgi:hypothetical protein
MVLQDLAHPGKAENGAEEWRPAQEEHFRGCTHVTGEESLVPGSQELVAAPVVSAGPSTATQMVDVKIDDEAP